MRYELIGNIFMGPPDAPGASLIGPREVIRWWDRRRLYFNLVVGCSGVLTCVLMIVCAVWAEDKVGEAIGLPDPVLFAASGVVLYAIAANVCYTAGWFLDALILPPKVGDRVRRKLFSLGLAFSVFVTLLPAVLSWLAFALAVIHGQRHAPPESFD